MSILVIGGGRMGTIRARHMVQKFGSNVVLVEPDEQARRTFLNEIPSCTEAINVPKALHSPIEAAFICTPPDSHFSAARLCVAARVPTFIEKPATLRLDDATQLCRLAASTQVPVLVGYHNRARPSVLELRRRLDSCDTLGFAGWWVCGTYSRSWWHRRESSGGGFLEQACHLVDLVSLLFGPSPNVSGSVVRQNGAAESAMLCIRSKSGTSGTLFYSSEASEKDIALRVFTSGGTLELRTWDFDLYVHGSLVEPGTDVGDRNAVFGLECDDFLARCRGHLYSLPLATLEDAVHTEQIIRSLTVTSVLSP